MTCKINADTTDGLKIVSDTSGAVDIQNNGTTIAEVSSGGLAVTVAGSGVTDALKLTTTATNTVPGIVFNADISNSAHDIARIRGQQDSSSAGGIIFETENSGSLAERARIASNGDFKINSGLGSVQTAYGCRAWIKLTGTGTAAEVESGNVASITDRGTGTYTVTFTTAMPDANYAAVVTTTWAAGVTEHVTGLVYQDSPYTPTTGNVTAKTYNFSNAGAAIDTTAVYVAVFR